MYIKKAVIIMIPLNLIIWLKFHYGLIVFRIMSALISSIKKIKVKQKLSGVK